MTIRKFDPCPSFSSPIWTTVNMLLTILLLVLLPGSHSRLDAQTVDQTLDSNQFLPEAEDLIAVCKSNWSDVAPLVAKIQIALDANDKESIKLKTLNRAYVKTRALRRDGPILVEMGEPAGVDFGFRGGQASILIEFAAKQLKGTTAGRKLLLQTSGKQSKSRSKRMKKVGELNKLIDQGKIEKAEKGLRSLQDEINNFILWVPPKDAQAIFKQLSAVSNKISSEASARRIAATTRAVDDAIRKQQINLEELTIAAANVAEKLITQNSVTFDGETRSGEEVFSLLCEKWQEAHTKLLNSIGREYAIQGGKIGFPHTEILGNGWPTETWVGADNVLAKRMKATLVAIIEADATHPAGSKLPTKYAQYVNAIGAMAGKMTDDSFVAECETALEKLAKQDSVFESRIADYRKATERVLHWRHQVAVSMAKEAAQSCVPTRQLIGDQKCLPKLTAGLNEVLPELSAHTGKKTSFNNVFGLTESASFSTCNDRIWASLNRSLLQQAEIDSLLHDLHVSPTSPPLTVNAAVAVSSAQNNQYESVGGEILSFHVEAFSTRLAKLKPQMGALFRIGDLPPDKAGLSDMLIRVAIEPEWVQHKYFFKRLK